MFLITIFLAISNAKAGAASDYFNEYCENMTKLLAIASSFNVERLEQFAKEAGTEEFNPFDLIEYGCENRPYLQCMSELAEQVKNQCLHPVN